MARLITTGFETGDLSDVYASSTTGTIGTSSPTPRTGSYWFSINNGEYAQLKSFTATDVLYGGFAAQRNQSGYVDELFKIIDAVGGVLITFRTNASNFMNYYMGDSATLLGTGTVTIPASQWIYVEFYYYCADASGRLQVKINGVTDIDFTGDTKPGTQTTAVAVRLLGASGGAGRWYFDDVVINDDAGSANNSFPGVIKLDVIRPNAAGDNTGLSRGGTDSGSNYGQVDEVPASATDYVYDTVVDEYDLYNATTVTVPAGATIKNVIPVAVALMDSGTGNIALMIKNGTTETTGDSQALNSTARPYSQAWNVNPDDSAAFEQADIDAIQIGVKIK